MIMMLSCRQEAETQEARPLALVKFSVLDLKSIIQKVIEQEKEAMVVGCKQEQQLVKSLTFDKYCVLDIETKVQEIQEKKPYG